MVDFAKPQRLGQMLGWGDNPFYKTFDANRNAVIQGFAGMGTDPMNPGGGFAKGFANGSMLDSQLAMDAEEEAKKAEMRQRYADTLNQWGGEYADLAQGVLAGGIEPADAYMTAWQRRYAPQAGAEMTADMRNWSYAQENPEFAQFLGIGGAPEPTDTQRNLMFRAEQAGLQPGTPEYQQFMMSGGQGGTSLSVDPATGGVSFTQGFAGKPLTEQQSKDTVYAVRAEGALAKLDPIDTELTNPWARAVEGDPTGLARGTQSPQFQQAAQAGKEFLQAILRKDTGAAITPQETAEYGTVYLPVPGDSPQVIEQKRISRARALEAMKAGMPPQAILAQERALLSGAGGDAPTAVNPQTGQKVRWDGSNWVPFT